MRRPRTSTPVRDDPAMFSTSTAPSCRTPFGTWTRPSARRHRSAPSPLIAPTRIIEAGRGAHGRRRQDGVPEHAGHRSAGRNEHLVPAVQGLLGGGEHHRHDPQHLHAARCPRARCALLVEADQRGAVPLRRRGRGDVRVAQLAAMGQRAHPGGDARAARRVRPPEQPGAAPRQPGRDHQRDPQRLPAAARACNSSGRRTAITARRSTTAAP